MQCVCLVKSNEFISQPSWEGYGWVLKVSIRWFGDPFPLNIDKSAFIAANTKSDRRNFVILGITVGTNSQITHRSNETITTMILSVRIYFFQKFFFAFCHCAAIQWPNYAASGRLLQHDMITQLYIEKKTLHEIGLHPLK